MYIFVSLLNIMVFRSFHMKEQAPSIPHFLELKAKPMQKGLFSEQKHLNFQGQPLNI